MIEDNGNCPYSYNKDFPNTFLYPADVDKFVSRDDVISKMPKMDQAILYQLILLAR